MESLKSFGFILWAPWLSVPTFIAIHHVAVSKKKKSELHGGRKVRVTSVGRIHPLGILQQLLKYFS